MKASSGPDIACRGRCGRVAGVVLAAALASSFGSTAVAAVTSGTIASIDAATRTLEVALKDGRSSTFAVPQEAKVLAVGKPVELDALVEGQPVSISVDKDDVVTTVRAGKPPARKVAPRRPAAGPPATGWHQYGGLHRDGRSSDTGLAASWPEAGPRLLGTAKNLGTGYSSVSVGGGRILTMGGRGDDECVICLDDTSLAERWVTRIGRTRPDGMGAGPRGTPTIDDDRVYALGANGDLACLAIDDGRVLWGGNILDAFNAKNITWGVSESPLVDGERVIVTPGGPGAAIVALDKRTGKPAWKAAVPGNPQTGYSSCIVIETGGVRQYVNFLHTGVVGVRADNGQVLWGNAASANGTANCSSPLEWRGHVFSASGYGTGGALVKLSGGRTGVTAALVYQTKDMKSHHGGMVIDGDHLYGTDEGVLKCLDVATGRVLWADRSVGKGSVAYADGSVILRGEEGSVALVEATPKSYVERGRFMPVNRSERPAWPHPVVTGGRLYLRDQDSLAVYGLAP